MLLTQSQLLRAVPELYRPRLNEFVASFNMYAVHFGIDNAKRVVHYLAQVFHESGNLRYVEEIASGAAYDTGAKPSPLAIRPRRTATGSFSRGVDSSSLRAERTTPTSTAATSVPKM